MGLEEELINGEIQNTEAMLCSSCTPKFEKKVQNIVYANNFSQQHFVTFKNLYFDSSFETKKSWT